MLRAQCAPVSAAKGPPSAAPISGEAKEVCLLAPTLTRPVSLGEPLHDEVSARPEVAAGPVADGEGGRSAPFSPSPLINHSNESSQAT